MKSDVPLRKAEDFFRADFVSFEAGGFQAWVKKSHADAIRRRLGDGLFAADTERLERAGGRDAPWVINLGPLGRCVVRAYRRGGLVRNVLPNTFVKDRVLAELKVAHFAFSNGVATPEPIAVLFQGRKKRAKAWFVSRLLENALDIESFCERLLESEQPLYSAAVALLDRIAELIWQMHETGICHADLNARNIVLAGEPTAPMPFVIDFDKAKLGVLSVTQRLTNLFRLGRSTYKLRFVREVLSDRMRLRFLLLYARRSTGVRNQLPEALRRFRHSLAFHRLFWRTPD